LIPVHLGLPNIIKMASRKGSFLERDVERTLKLSGLKPKLNKIKNGYEIDVSLDIEGYSVMIECKAYEKGGLHLINLIHQWESKNKEIGADKILFVIIGKDVSQREKTLAKKHNITIWDEDKWEKIKDKVIDERESSKDYVLNKIDPKISKNKKSENTEDIDEDIILSKQQEKIMEALDRFKHNYREHRAIEIKERGEDYKVIISLQEKTKNFLFELELQERSFTEDDEDTIKLDKKMKKMIKYLQKKGFKFHEFDLSGKNAESQFKDLPNPQEKQIIWAYYNYSQGWIFQSPIGDEKFNINFGNDSKIVSLFVDEFFQSVFKANKKYVPLFKIKYC
jgi:hypothetical protein